MDFKLIKDLSGEYYVAITDHGDLKVMLTKSEEFDKSYRISEWSKFLRRYAYIIPSGYGQTETSYLFKDIADAVDKLRKYNPIVRVSLPNVDLDLNGKVYASWLTLSAAFFTGVLAGAISAWIMLT